MLTQRIYQRLIRGLEQYLWFLGQDTKDPKNNLLVEYGFHRYRTPFHGGSCRYQIPWGLKIVELHSFCVGLYGRSEAGFIFIRAHDRAYVYKGLTAPLPGRYRKEYLAYPADPETWEIFHSVSSEFLQWLEHYEGWVEQTFGREYRRDCYDRYHRKWLAPDLAREWFNEYRFDLEGLKLQLENFKKDRRVRAA